MNRRTYMQAVAGGSLATLAGCMGVLEEATGGDGEEPTHEIAGEEAWVSRREQSTQRATRIDAEIELDPGYYVAREFEPTRRVLYGAEWQTDGNPVDILTLDRSEYDQRFREGEEFQYSFDVSEMDTTRGSFQSQMSAGEYVIVVSNSELLGTEPEGSVRVDFSFGAGF